MSESEALIWKCGLQSQHAMLNTVCAAIAVTVLILASMRALAAGQVLEHPDAEHVKQGDIGVRIYVYNLSAAGFGDPTCQSPNTFVCQFTRRLLNSQFYTTDPARAHYFYIPHSGTLHNRSFVQALFGHIRQSTAWQHSVHQRQTRHIMVLQSECKQDAFHLRVDDSAMLALHCHACCRRQGSIRLWLAAALRASSKLFEPKQQ